MKNINEELILMVCAMDAAEKSCLLRSCMYTKENKKCKILQN